MKFTDGNWLIRDGYHVLGALQAHDFDQQDGKLTAYVSPRPIVTRANMLDTMLLTVKFHSPIPGVVGVKLIHHEGVAERGPVFELTGQTGDHVTIEEDEDAVILTSGTLSVRIRKGSDWGVDFYRGTERITGSTQKSMAYITGPAKQAYMREELDLGVGEYVYGLGERFTPFVKNGQIVDIWNQDGGTSSEQSYKNIPFYVSNKGYGVFVNQPELVFDQIDRFCTPELAPGRRREAGEWAR